MTVDITKGKLEGCVVSEHTTATDIGISMLEQGGNAIDAIVATILAVGTLCPYHSDIGGSGFALVRTPDGEHHALAFRGTAPVGLPPIPRTKKLIGKDAATSKFYQDGASTQMGGSAVAVPGEIKGLKALHERYGTLAWANLVQPSIDLARDGFELHQDMYEYTDKCTVPPGCGKIDGSFYEDDPMYTGLFDKGGRLRPAGSHWSRPEYAETLKILAEEGDEPFYSGRIAEDIVKVVQARGGLLNMQDMETYDIKWLDAIEADYKGGKVYSVPAPASGAMFISALGLLSTFEHEGEGSDVDLHRTTEAMKLAFGLRAELGDPEFVPELKEKQQQWTSTAGIAERAKMISDDKTHPADYYKSPEGTFANADHGTSNITATDSSGLMCSVTTTVGLPWGSKIMMPKWGFVLNDTMDDFSIEGRPNGFGYEPSPTNLVQGRKRPLSSSCPYIVERDGRPILVGGAAGGSAIITANIQVARNVLEYGMTAQDAVAANRIHDQIQPKKTCLERAKEGATKGHTEAQARALEAKGHTIEWLPQATSTCCVVKISYDEEGKMDWEPAGEPRKHMAGGKIYRPAA